MVKGVRALVEPHYDVVGTASDGQQLVDSVLELKPDLVVMDISMPKLNGLEAAARIRKLVPSARLIFLTMQSNPIYLRRALEVGANGYVLKTGSMEELVDAARCVMAGETYISPGFGDEVLAGLLNRSGKPSREEHQLTGRQRQILQLVAEGRPSKEIAHLLNVSVKTVEYHRAQTMARLGTRSVAETVRVAVEQGIIPPAAPGAS